MTKSAQVRARIEPDVKETAENVLSSLGMTMSDAISVFLNQVILHKGLPFPVRVPSDELLEAMREAREGETTTFSFEEFAQDVNTIWNEENNADK